jgi:hypothetical protein
MASRYIRPEVDYNKEVPNNPFNESSNPVSDSVSVSTNQGPVELGDLTIVRGKLRVASGGNDPGNQDYGVF